jgi:hypothetical protein
MRRNLLLCVSVLLLVQGAALAADDVRGTYVGAYTNKAGKTGRYQLTLTPADGRWTGEVVAVLDGRETRSPMTSLVVRGDSIEASYDFEVQGHKASSRIKGQKTGEVLSGTFETLYKGKVVDTGTWKTSLKK